MKINLIVLFSLNFWSKNLQAYNPNNVQLVKALGFDASVQAQLADEEKRSELCRKQEQVTHSVSNCIQVVGQICNQVKLLLSKCNSDDEHNFF